MLVEKYINGLNQRSQLEFKNISKDIIPWLEKTALENNCLIDKKVNITATLFMITSRFVRTVLKSMLLFLLTI